MLAAATLLATAPLASATVSAYGTYLGDSALFGFSNTNTQGYVTVSWTGYASPFTPGVPGYRVKIYSSANSYLAPIVDSYYPAYGSSTNYSYRYYVPIGYTMVTVYATGNQYSNSPNVNWDYVTSSWIHNQ